MLKDDIGYLIVAGAIEMISIGKIKNELHKHALEDDYKAVEIDIENVPYIDSSGIGALLSFVRDRRQHHKEAYVTKVAPGVLHVLQMSGLEKYFFKNVDNNSRLHNIEEI